MNEGDTAEWIPTQYAGYYVNEHGAVRGPSGRVLRPGRRSGYLSIHVTGGKNALVHQLVCIAFHGPRPTPTHQAAHNNGNPLDNRAVNLRWATRSENTKDALRHGALPPLPARPGELNPRARLTWDEVAEIRSEYAAGRASTRALARRFGVSHGHIQRIVVGSRWVSSDQAGLSVEEETTHE